eukprot:COSAG02_NODE_928_length_15853_cov_9.053574_14_plen_80_part_00
MTGPETQRAHQISRSELLICVYESVPRPGRPDSEEGLSSVYSQRATPADLDLFMQLLNVSSVLSGTDNGHNPTRDTGTL